MNKATAELAAMQAVAAALGSLEHADSRQRVLQWAGEHFGERLVPSVVTSVSPARAAIAAGDPENLDSLFDEDVAPTLVAQPVEPVDKRSVMSAVSSFVADFQRLARDLQSA